MLYSKKLLWCFCISLTEQHPKRDKIIKPKTRGKFDMSSCNHIFMVVLNSSCPYRLPRNAQKNAKITTIYLYGGVRRFFFGPSRCSVALAQEAAKKQKAKEDRRMGHPVVCG
jgi:hypothetical protein